MPHNKIKTATWPYFSLLFCIILFHFGSRVLKLMRLELGRCLYFASNERRWRERPRWSLGRGTCPFPSWGRDWEGGCALPNFTARRYALHGLSYRNSVRPSVCPSVTLVHCVHMVQPTIMISSPYGSHIILVSGDIKFIPKFEGDHPERGRWMGVGWVLIGDFRPISHGISETVRDTTKVTINH